VAIRSAVVACLFLVMGCTAATPATPQPTPASSVAAAPSAVPTVAFTLSPSPTGIGYAGSGWTASALGLEGVGATFVFHCPAGGSAGTVWGSDVYTADSSVCTAAVHAGVITFGVGGDVTIELRPGQDAYEGSTRFGLTTLSYPAYDSSFVVVGAPQPSPAASASPGQGEGFGPFQPLFSDDFSDPASGWGTGTLATGTIEYEVTGALVVKITQAGQSLRSTYRLDTAWNVLRIDATVTPTGEGHFGLACAASLNEMVGALVDTNGDLTFFRITGGTVSVLSRQDTSLPIVAGMPVEIALECAGTASAATRLRVEIDGALAGTYDGADDGPATFGELAVVAEAVTAPFSVAVDELSVGGSTGANLPPPVRASPSAVDDLLSHVPVQYRNRCQPTPVSMFEAGGLVAVACSLQQSGAGAEIVEYVQFDSTASMNAAYQARVSHFGSQSTGTSCQNGPSELSYSVGGVSVGRLLCAPQTAGIRLDWTDERVNILSYLADFDSGYAELYDSWLEAGPEQ